MATASESTALTTEKETISKLIEMYGEMPYLYNKNDKNYFNKSLRDEGFKVLLDIYKNFDKNATIKTLKKKIDNLKTTYFRELKKVKESRQTGAGTEDIYVPTLWYFEAFHFLVSPAEPCRQPVDSLESPLSSGEENDNPNIPRPLKKRKNSLMSKQESLIDKANQLLSKEDNSFDVLGKAISYQLRDLNKRQLTISRKLISDVLYYATLDRLNEDSHIALGTTSFQRSLHQLQSFHPTPSPTHHLQSPYPTPSPPHQLQSSHPTPSPTYQLESPHTIPSTHHQLQSHNPTPSPSHQLQLPRPTPSSHHQLQSPYPTPSPPHQLQSSHPTPSPPYQLESPHTIPSSHHQLQSHYSTPSPSHQLQLPRPTLSSHHQLQLPHPTPSPPHQLQSPRPIPSSHHQLQSPHLTPSPLQQLQSPRFPSSNNQFHSTSTTLQQEYHLQSALDSSFTQYSQSLFPNTSFSSSENQQNSTSVTVEGYGEVMKDLLIFKPKKS